MPSNYVERRDEIKSIGRRLSGKVAAENRDVQQRGRGKSNPSTFKPQFTTFDCLQVAPQAESLSDLYETVVASPSRKYFIVLLMTFVGFIFFVGLLFGRVIVPRRHIALKNK